MKFALATVALATLAAAAPKGKRQDASGITDADILQYALTLEHLEATFYADALTKFTEQDFLDAGFAAPFYANLVTLAADEKAHVDFLTSGLSAAGADPVAACTYDFGYTDAKSFLTISKVLEGVGVSAYTGAAQFITDKAYLTAAASILDIEARHSSYINSVLGQQPFPAPFDTPLGFDSVYSLAAPFFVSCPDTNAALPVKAFPALTVGGATTYSAGDSITLESTAANATEALYAAFYSGLSVYYVPFNGSAVTIPADVFGGQTYVVLTTSADAASDSNTVAGPAILNVQTESTYQITPGSGSGCVSGTPSGSGSPSSTGSRTPSSSGSVGNQSSGNGTNPLPPSGAGALSVSAGLAGISFLAFAALL